MSVWLVWTDPLLRCATKDREEMGTHRRHTTVAQSDGALAVYEGCNIPNCEHLAVAAYRQDQADNAMISTDK